MTEGALTITPDAELAAALASDGRALRTMVTVCLDETGAATRVVTRPSRLPAFDRAALDVVAGWRFRPYRDGDAAVPACSVAMFRHGVEAPAGKTLAPDWANALPAAELELPTARYVEDALPSGSTTRPPTPGVALARICRRGSTDAPQLTWLQSSGDPIFDRELFDRRVAVPVGEPMEPGIRCDVVSSIARPHESGPPPDPASTTPVSAERLEARRISGDKAIFPADRVRDTITSDGIQEFLVEVQVCLDRVGRPAAITLLRSSGYTGYDMDLINGIALWRYTPFTVDGQSQPACGVVNFAYRQVQPTGGQLPLRFD